MEWAGWFPFQFYYLLRSHKSGATFSPDVHEYGATMMLHARMHHWAPILSTMQIRNRVEIAQCEVCSC